MFFSLSVVHGVWMAAFFPVFSVFDTFDQSVALFFSLSKAIPGLHRFVLSILFAFLVDGVGLLFSVLICVPPGSFHSFLFFFLFWGVVDAFLLMAVR